MRALGLLVFALLCPGVLSAQSVGVERGNVVYRASARSALRRLTSSGLDSQPRLSADGRLVAFVRATPGDSVDTASGQEGATSLWTVRVDGTEPRMRVRGRYAEAPQRVLAGLQAPQFSPDGRRIYFLSSAWATSGAVHVFELATGRERFVVAGNSLEVVPSGEYAGHLLVEQHRYFLAGGSYDWVWLVTPEGKDVGSVGEGEEAVEEFRSLYVKP